MRRAGLWSTQVALLVGLSVGVVGSLAAQEVLPPLVPEPAGCTPPWFSHPVVQPDGAVSTSPFAPPIVPAPVPPRPVNDFFRSLNFCCGCVNINHVGCGTLKSECTYIFGSCRAFYCEPCLPKPGPTTAYGYQAPAHDCGCGP